jgi:multidrug efflux system membrane fusion protein
VALQRTHEELAVITHGVEAGELVVTDGQLRLGPGARVVIRPGATTSSGAGTTMPPEAAPAATPASGGKPASSSAQGGSSSSAAAGGTP